MPSHIVAEENIGHNHSYLGTLRGLLLWGLLTGQRDYVDVVSATFDNAVRTHCVTPSGYAPHDLGRKRFCNDHGEPVSEDASCGDATQLALWLGLRCGRAELLDDVERWIRSRILPAQITADDGGPDPRHLGGWGVHGDPHGKGCILDVLAAVAHTVCDVHEHVLARTPLGLQLNLHFSGDYGAGRILIQQAGEARSVIFEPRTPGPYLLRVPGWAPADSITVERAGKSACVKRVGRYLRVDDETDLRPLTLRYALPRSASEETIPGGRTFRIEWLGDDRLTCAPAP